MTLAERTSPVPRFLVLLPITRPPHLLEIAVETVLRQSEQDFELHIISDGTPEATRQKIVSLCRTDSRLTAHLLPKGRRNGEYYRDPIIRGSKALYVCQIADDDLWFPSHLAQIAELLALADFGHTLQTEAAPGFRLLPLLGDITDPEISQRMLLNPFNIFGPTACGYTREAYLRLDPGWEAAPEGVFSDLFMWRKFLARGDIRCRSRSVFTNLQPSAVHHRGSSLMERRAINRKWLEIISDGSKLARLEDCLRTCAASRQPGNPFANPWVAFDPEG